MAENLENFLQSIQNPVETFRNNDLGGLDQYVFPDEYTNWIEEQRAVRESAGIVDQSFHMETLRIEGPEAVDLLAHLGINNFTRIRTEDPPQAINLVVCNHEGYVIGDVILFYLGEETFDAVGENYVNNWIKYNAGISDLDVTTRSLYDPYVEGGSPPDFRFQIQGPHAIDIMEEVVDGSLPEIPFFQMDTIEIDGVQTYALGHGMAAMPGLEIFGPYEAHDDVLEKILAAGEQYGIRRLGSKAYKTGKIGSGWFVMSVPAIYENDEMKGYREWLDIDTIEAQLSIGGSYVSDDITDYYMDPLERGWGPLIDFDHDFIGKEALQEMDQERERVTFVWNQEDVVDVYASLFREGETKKYIDLPDTANTWSKTHYDTVLKDGEHVGFSKYPGYLYYKREMLSLGTIDVEYSDPGTEVTFIWGDDSKKRGVERHQQTEIRATVAASPYVRGGRKDM
ncbi:aminomethyltransferase family protein [Halobellus limi]|uniref:Aminomethyl transferase family protein n=1 Tax=Halobellus limi TaxID=699433 RepID=A0A1H6BQZ3_9EURY|nr:aminomethyltransferase family protein [Halobellus limi]QCC49369.1 aminomethyl transferase family protein [Halobellus limi]SEG63104.1 vanillate/3-O-methylgallate O-demethylase [Halobellus limi]